MEKTATVHMATAHADVVDVSATRLNDISVSDAHTADLSPSVKRKQRPRRTFDQNLSYASLFEMNNVVPLEHLEHRLRVIALHIPWYGFRTQARLARDSGVSRAAVSRIIRHHAQPSLSIALRLTKALSLRLGRPLDVWEVFSLDGTYPTTSVCELCGCRSCSFGTVGEQTVNERNGGR